MSSNLTGASGRRLRTILSGLAIGVSLLAAGCSSTESVGSAETSTSAPLTTDTVVTDTVAADTTTTAAPETTLAAATTAAPTTTAAPPPPPLTLRGDGVGTFTLGMPYTDVLAGLSARLTLETDDAYDFPVVDDYGGHRSADENQGFVAPYGRVTCWSDGATGQFCAAFGGDDATALTFVGWTYGGSVLSTASGATGGSLWSEFPTMITPGQGGCFLNSSGSIDGVVVSVVSAGATFGSFDDAGNFVPGDPNPADVSITGFDAGDYPYDTNADC